MSGTGPNGEITQQSEVEAAAELGRSMAPERAPTSWRDWRVLLGIAITVIAFWYAIRGIPVTEVVDSMKRADLLVLFGLSVPAYLASVLFRALRWRHLTNPVAPLSRNLLGRGVAIGFMVNNLVPLRIGEVVRAWYVAREGGASSSAIFGTVVLERVIDIVAVLVVALGALAFVGTGSAESTFLSQGAVLLLPAGLVPLGALFMLRLAPDRVIRIAHFFLKPLPERFSTRVDSMLRSFSQGLGALSGGSHLFWIVFHSAVIWLLLSLIPMLAGLLAFDVELGSTVRLLVVSYIVLGAVGVAVAIPSAPGFFGTYQLAFKTVLEQFGVDSATALAIGLVVWFIFWVTLTVLGVIVMRFSGTSLADLTSRRPG